MKDPAYQSFYHLLFDHAKIGIVVISDKGVIEDANPNFCVFIGYSQQELITLNVAALLHPDELVNDPPALGLLDSGITVVKERRLICKDGTMKYAELHAQRLEPNRYLVLLHDISLRKEALIRSEEKFRRIVECSQEGIWEMDAGHRTTYVNRRMAEMLQYSQEEMTGRKVEDFFFPEDLEEHGVRMKERHEGRNDNYERRFRRKDGIACWTHVSPTALHDEKGNFSGSYGLFTEITEKKQMEEHIRTSEERLLTLINASPDLICFKDSAGRWVLANNFILDLYCLRGVDYRGKTEFDLADYTAPLYQDAFRNCQGSDDLAWERGTASRTTEFIPDIHGVSHVFDVVKVPLYQPNGEKKGIVVFGRDITEIKDAELALKESENRFRGFFENAPIGIWEEDLSLVKKEMDDLSLAGVTDFDDYFALHPEELKRIAGLVAVLDMNETSVAILGEKNKDSMIRNLPYYFREDSYEMFRKEIIALKNGSSTYNIEIPVYTRIGKRFLNLTVALQPGFEANWKRVLVSFVDISERRLAEEKIRLLSEFQAKLLRVGELKEIHEMVADTVHRLIDGCLVFTTNIDQSSGIGRVMAHAGLPVAESQLVSMLGMDPFSINFYMKDVKPDELLQFRSGKLELMRGGIVSVSSGNITPENAAKAAEALGVTHVYYIGFVYREFHHGGILLFINRDLTKFSDTLEMIASQASVTMNRMKAEAALKEANDRFRLAFLTSPDAININELFTGEYIEVNDGFLKMTGYSREEVIGRTANELGIWVDPADREAMVAKLMADGKINNYEARFRLKNGEFRTGLMSAATIYLNNAPHIISITRDIEEKKQFEREILKARDIAEEASKLKTAFLNNISHEVRTPMNAIVGFSDLLQSEVFSPDERNRYFSIIQSNARQLLSIIDDVLEVSRLDSGRIPVNPVSFSLSELCEDIHMSMNDQPAVKDVRLFYQLDDDIQKMHIVADREKIRQVICGLIGNALKFTFAGTVEFGCLMEEPGKILFFVRDTGIGIPVEAQPHIFERFYQVQQSTPQGTRGTGLGLSIARGLVQMMGGEITVESEPGKGSTFRIIIPFEESLSVKSTTQFSGPFEFGNLTLLVAEDEEYNFDLLEILLSKRIKKLVRARNGLEVLSLLDEAKPDLILMDLKMPEMDGYAASREVVKRNPSQRIVALTAYTQPEEEHRAREAGCCAFISKPIRKEELFDTIRRCMNP